MTQPPVSNRLLLIVLTASILLTGVPCFAEGLPPQTIHRRGFEPASKEVQDVLAQFYEYDSSRPLDLRVVEEWSTDEAHFEKVVFTTQGGERVPGELALPLEVEGPVPAALLLHGLGNSRERWWEDDRRELPGRLLAGGIAVLAIDLELHGERSAANDYQNPVYLTLGDTQQVRSRDLLIQSTIDARLALAVLRSRPEIDADRLVVVGYSLGAMISTFLGALEPDLRAIVTCAIPTTEQPLPIDPFQFAPRIGVSWLLQVGRNDWLSAPEDAQRLLGLSLAPERSLRVYESGHQLPSEFASEAASWILGQTLRRAQ